jgi:hypothetical protein
MQVGYFQSTSLPYWFLFHKVRSPFYFIYSLVWIEDRHDPILDPYTTSHRMSFLMPTYCCYAIRHKVGAEVLMLTAAERMRFNGRVPFDTMEARVERLERLLLCRRLLDTGQKGIKFGLIGFGILG